MKILAIIPARYASTRFPGKPLVDIDGQPMIQRVYFQAKKAIPDVIVATDNSLIFDAVKKFNGQVALTSESHQSGTDRCAEVILKHAEFDAAINVQGDEPFIDPTQITQVAELLECGAKIGTLVKKTDTETTLQNPNKPKVLLDKQMNAIDFSRTPFADLQNSFQHIGIYGYQRSTLLEITQLRQTPRELSERLEQLRWLDHGYSIKAAITAIETQSIDTPEDLKTMLDQLKTNK